MLLLRKASLIFGANLLLLSAPMLLDSEQAARPGPREAGRVQFNDVAAKWGITFRHENGASAEKHMFETFGSGVGVIDFDNDGQPDLFFANGADLAHGKPSPGNALYRNLGNGKFEDVTAKAGVAYRTVTLTISRWAGRTTTLPHFVRNIGRDCQKSIPPLVPAAPAVARRVLVSSTTTRFAMSRDALYVGMRREPRSTAG